MAKQNKTDQHNLLYLKIGKKIQDFRKKKGYNQEELASGIGLTRTSMVNIEKGRQPVTIEALLKICAILHCKPVDILPPTPKAVGKELKKVKKVIVQRTLDINFKW